MATLKEINFYFQIVCSIGVILSAYAFYIETNVEKDKNYKAYCDIMENISCTKAFSSKWGKGFGLVDEIFGKNSLLYQPNSLFGIFFYMTMGSLGLSNNESIVKVQIAFGFLSNIMSIYLAYILYYELYDMCLICAGTYLINFIILTLCSVKLRLLFGLKKSSVTSKSKTEVKTKSE